MGGFYEKMVGLLKRILRKILANARLDYEELLTVVTEVESILNSRPISYVYTEETEEPICPSHLVTNWEAIDFITRVSGDRLTT